MTPPAGRPMPPAEWAALAEKAIRCTGLAVSPTGAVYVTGRHALGISDTTIEVAPEDIITTAAALSTWALTVLRRQSAALPAVKA